ncbi:MAG: acyl-CoA dehydrogenase family protein [Gammaproteobacteria bacterium]
MTQDSLAIDTHFSPEELRVRDTVRNFVDTEITHRMQEAYETAEFPVDIIPKLAQLDLFNLSTPAVTYGLACQELEKGDSSIRSFVSVQKSLCMFPIFKYGTDIQRKLFLPQMAQGKVIGCFGLTETNSGSDPASLQTTAKKTDGGWLLNGEKMWITTAPIADLAIIWAKTTDGIRGFLIEKHFAGFSTKKIIHKVSMRTSITGEITLTNCFVPESYYLPGTEIGLPAALHCLTEARYGIAWGAIGAAMDCYDIALDYAKNRTQFKQPLASFQLIQKDLVDMFTAITQARLLNLHVGRLKDQEKSTFMMISMAKMNSCKIALDVARKARDILGARGITLEHPIIRHMINLESVSTYEGTDNIHHLIIGKALTGFNAFSA